MLQKDTEAWWREQFPHGNAHRLPVLSTHCFNLFSAYSRRPHPNYVLKPPSFDPPLKPNKNTGLVLGPFSQLAFKTKTTYHRDTARQAGGCKQQDRNSRGFQEASSHLFYWILAQVSSLVPGKKGHHCLRLSGPLPCAPISPVYRINPYLHHTSYT